MTLERILSKKHYRRSFFIIFSLTVVVLIIIRHIALPTFDNRLRLSIFQIIGNITDGILISLTITVALGIFIFLLTPDIMSVAQMEIIEPRSISDLLEKAMMDTEVWWYKGGCGRYFRVKTLPAISKAVRSENAFKEINVLILDPTNSELCENYATYRKSLKSANGDIQWDKKRVKREVYATILAIAIRRHEEPLLQINLGLTNQFSSFRFDLSSHYVIITKEDRYAPAMRCDRDTFFYQSYRDEMRLLYHQSKKVHDINNALPLSHNISPNQVEELFQKMNLADIDMNHDDFEEILNLVQQSKNPYA